MRNPEKAKSLRELVEDEYKSRFDYYNTPYEMVYVYGDSFPPKSIVELPDITKWSDEKLWEEFMKFTSAVPF